MPKVSATLDRLDALRGERSSNAFESAFSLFLSALTSDAQFGEFATIVREAHAVFSARRVLDTRGSLALKVDGSGLRLMSHGIAPEANFTHGTGGHFVEAPALFALLVAQGLAAAGDDGMTLVAREVVQQVALVLELR